MLVCWCDRIEDMAVEHSWSAHYNAASEASLTSFCAVNLHSLDCVCVVQIIHSVHHPPYITIRMAGEAKILPKISKIFPFTDLCHCNCNTKGVYWIVNR